MYKLILAAGAAAVALSAVPADAKHYTNITKCSKWRHHRCVAWHRMTRAQARRAGYAVGYRFAPTYAYTDYASLPAPFVTQYRLNRNWRYVNQNGRVYVVNPRTYRVTRVLMLP